MFHRIIFEHFEVEIMEKAYVSATPLYSLLQWNLLCELDIIKLPRNPSEHMEAAFVSSKRSEKSSKLCEIHSRVAT